MLRDAVDQASIPTNYTRLIAQELGMHARDLPRLLGGTSLSADSLLDEHTRLSGTEQIQILDNALAISGDPALGLRLGRRLTPAVHGPMGYLACSSPNLLAAMQAFHAFLPTRLSFARLQLRQCGDFLTIDCHFQIAMRPAVSRCLADTCAMAFFACAEFVVGRPAHEALVQFQHADPGVQADYAHYMPGRVEFGCAQMCLRLPLSLCQIPNASANHQSVALAQQQCEALLAELQQHPQSIKRQIEAMLLSHPTGMLTEDAAASALFMSTRTLARRLKIEGSSFRQIRDDVLARQASRYLLDNRLSVDAIANLLGYHDSSNFRRAFKRWFGQPPDQFRATRGGATSTQTSLPARECRSSGQNEPPRMGR